MKYFITSGVLCSFQLLELSAKLGPALQVGESLVWKAAEKERKDEERKMMAAIARGDKLPDPPAKPDEKSTQPKEPSAPIKIPEASAPPEEFASDKVAPSIPPVREELRRKKQAPLPPLTKTAQPSAPPGSDIPQNTYPLEKSIDKAPLPTESQLYPANIDDAPAPPTHEPEEVERSKIKPTREALPADF